MTINRTTMTAWRLCGFCGRTDEEIIAIILDKTRWKELPLGYSCAWKRITQVGFGKFARTRKDLWSALCTHRADTCNRPSYDWTMPSDWAEDWCDTYWAVWRENEKRLQLSEKPPAPRLIKRK